MRYDLLPEDLYHFYFMKLIFAECNKCNKLTHYTNVVSNCKIFIYKSVFDDDYGFNEEIESFEHICKDCINTYSKRYVINTEINKFNWINNL